MFIAFLHPIQIHRVLVFRKRFRCVLFCPGEIRELPWQGNPLAYIRGFPQMKMIDYC